MNRLSLLALRSAAALTLSAGALAQTIFVDANLTSGANDGSSWADAYQGPLGLADALTASVSGQDIYVADGVYHPAAPGSSRAITLRLKNGVRVYGGFEGGEANLFQRPAFGVAPSILSGDLADDDTPAGQNRGENSFHVIGTGGTNPTALINGFTVTAGNANGSGNGDVGGGILCLGGASPTVENCLFQRNSCTFGGGAGYINGAAPSFTDCSFDDNNGGSFGGAFDIATGGAVLFNRCTFTRNRASRAGALEIFATNQVRVVNCFFSENVATGGAGGGGIWIGNGGSTQVRNCTIVGNTSSSTLGGGIRVQGASPSFRNLILWDNEGPGGAQNANNQIAGSSNIQYSIIENTSVTANGVTNADPMFVDPANGDYRLQAGSPAIDAGDSGAVTAGITLDAGMQRRFVDDPLTMDTGIGGAPIVDFGAFEYSAGALGSIYCDAVANSTGVVGTVDAFGSAVASANVFMLNASNLPVNQFGIFVVSRTQGFTAGPGGSAGNLCLGGAIGRIQGPGQIVSSGASGAFTITLDLTAIPTPTGTAMAMAGEAWSFQAWHRDTIFGNATSGYTDATTVVFN